jgi:hypothetical protein
VLSRTHRNDCSKLSVIEKEISIVGPVERRGLSQFLLFGLLGLGLAASLADVYYTQSGMQLGLVEANPLNRFLFKKIGQGLTAFLEIGAFLFGTAILSVKSPAGAFVTAGTVTVSETIMAIRNYKLVQKAKASKK